MATEAVTVSVGAKATSGMKRPFEEMARDAKQMDALMKQFADSSKKGFDGLHQSIKLSQQSMDKFADSIRKGADAQKNFGQFGNVFGKGGGGGGGGMGGGGALQLNQSLEIFEKISRAGNDLVGIFDLLGGKINEKALSGGFLGRHALEGASMFESGMSSIYGRAGLNADQVRAAQGTIEKKVGTLGGFVSGAAARGLEKDALAQIMTGLDARMQQAQLQQATGGLADLAARKRFEASAGGLSGLDREMFINEQERNRYRGMTPGMEKDLAASKQLNPDFVARLGNKAAGLDQAGREAIALAKAVDLQEKLVASEQKKYDLIQQQGKARQDQLKTQLDFAKSEEQRLRSTVEQEKARLGGFAGEFGRLDPFEQQRAKELAAKVGAGGQLAGADLEAARGFGFFGDVVARRDQQIGEQAGFGGIAKALGLDLRQREAEIALKAVVEAKIDISNKITAELNINAQSLTDQMAERVRPELEKLSHMIEARIRAEIARDAHIARASRQGAG